MGRSSVLIIVALAMFILPVAHSETAIHATFTIGDNDDQVVQTLQYTFDQPLEDYTLNYQVSQNVKDVKVTSAERELQFQANTSADQYVIVIKPDKPIQNLTISFTVDNILFHNGDVSHFFTELSFNPENIPKISAEVILPTGYGLYGNSFRPESGKVITDGQNIIVQWKDLPTDRPVFFSIKYQQLTHSQILLWVTLIILLCAFLVTFYFYHIHKTKEVFLLGFREDEKKVINYIKEKGKILQKDLQKEFGFSRAKSTRIIKRLEQEGLISKEEWGRTNKIQWKHKEPHLPLENGLK
jgi:uncharacterized membrane protein